MICKKVEKCIRTRDRETKELPSKFTLEARVQTFHRAVELRHDKDMSDAIAGVDLLVKDFMKHESCMKNYTSIVRVNDKSASHEKIDEWVLVRQSIDETVIENGVCISLDTLLELKGIQKKDHQTRRNLKSWVERNYGNKIVFLSTESSKGQLIMSKKCLEDVSRGEKVLYNTAPLNDDIALRHAATVLRCLILECTENTESLPWPPTVESLPKRLASTPALLLEFFRSILASEHTHHLTAESTAQLAESFAQDLMFGISRGTFLTLKQSSLGLGFHNMIGQKLPIFILSHLGQSITYHAVWEVETAKAEVSEYYSKSGMT